MNDVLSLVGRLALVAIFATSGFDKFGNIDGIGRALASKGVPLPTVAAWLTPIVETGFAILIAVGYRVRLSALALVLFTIAATVLFHNFWAFADAGARNMQQLQFMKNLAIVGGLLLLVARGGGRLGLDGARGGRA